jgi:hypothetical protein
MPGITMTEKESSDDSRPGIDRFGRGLTLGANVGVVLGLDASRIKTSSAAPVAGGEQ